VPYRKFLDKNCKPCLIICSPGVNREGELKGVISNTCCNVQDVIFFYFIKACPITLGNATCRGNLAVHQEASFAVSFYIVHNFFYSSFVNSKSKSIDSIKVMNGFRNFMINSCLLVGQCPGWTMFFFRIPLCFSRSMHWYSKVVDGLVSLFADICCVVQ